MYYAIYYVLNKKLFVHDAVHIFIFDIFYGNMSLNLEKYIVINYLLNL